MRPSIRTARDVSIGALTAWGLYELTPRLRAMTAHDKKETPMAPVYDAETLDLSHLYPVRIRYAPKDINAEAIQATEYTIGKLSLEFEAEICLNNGDPFFQFDAKRFDVTQPDGQIPPQRLSVRVSDWIVPLWGELHVFTNQLFRNTFEVEETLSPGVPPYAFEDARTIS